MRLFAWRVFACQLTCVPVVDVATQSLLCNVSCRYFHGDTNNCMKCDIVFSIKRTRPVLSTSIESAVLALAYTRLQ